MSKLFCFFLPFLISPLFAQEELFRSISVDYHFAQQSADRSYSYQFHRFNPIALPNGAHEHFQTDPFNGSTERFNFLSLRAYWALNNRVAVHFDLPLHMKERSSENAIFQKSQNGVGDISMGLNYRWFSSRLDRTDHKNTLVATLGAAIRLPSGVYKRFDEDGELEPLLQAGTGARAYSATHILSLSIQQLAMQLETGIRVNEKNEFGYRHGHELNLKLGLSRAFFFNDYFLVGELGVAHEIKQPDEMNGQELNRPEVNTRDSGGAFMSLPIGLQLVVSQISISARFAPVLWQQVNGFQPERDFNGSIGIAYRISQKK